MRINKPLFYLLILLKCYTLNNDLLTVIYINMTPKDLRSAGLETKEAVCYLSLLELGKATMGDLVKKSKLKRTTLYDILEVLKGRGLVSTSKKGKKNIYIAENPQKLKEEAEENTRSIEKLMPELLSIANIFSKKPKLRYFEGRAGIIEVYKDILKFPHEKIHAWAPESIIHELDRSFFDVFYTPKLIEQKMLIELIAPNLPIFQNYKIKNTVPTRKIKLIDPIEFPFSVEITLYGPGNIAILSYQDQIGLIIESNSIANTLKSIFKLQWGQLG